MRGADGKTPELRAPSIKGNMRFWWRAFQTEPDYTKLLSKENSIFGGTDKKEGASSIKIRIPEQPEIEQIGLKLWDELPPNKTEGIHYLLCSVLIKKDKEPQAYIKSGTYFDVMLSSREVGKLQQAVRAFYLLSLCGGLGSRARRGAGSFRVIDAQFNNISHNDFIEEYHKFFNMAEIRSAEGFQRYIETLFSYIFRDDINSSNEYHSPWSRLRGSRWYILSPQKSWLEALNFIGTLFRDFRNENKSDISNTPNFGFPIIHKKSDTVMNAGHDTDNGKIDLLQRRASPLIFKIIKTQPGIFFPVVIWLNGELLPPGYEIMDKNGNNCAAASDEIIRGFLNTLPNGVGEVVL